MRYLRSPWFLPWWLPFSGAPAQRETNAHAVLGNTNPGQTSPSQDSESRFHKKKSPQSRTSSSANSPQSSTHIGVKRYTFLFTMSFLRGAGKLYSQWLGMVCLFFYLEMVIIAFKNIFLHSCSWNGYFLRPTQAQKLWSSHSKFCLRPRWVRCAGASGEPSIPEAKKQCPEHLKLWPTHL